ncbi:MAG TPA: CvpA family protein [Myxococcota bacterium]|nr:CvpA family protein [Myxococcota bacterium]HQK52285.1 CvpA family protein [Myxococcota bacterium]
MLDYMALAAVVLFAFFGIFTGLLLQVLRLLVMGLSALAAIALAGPAQRLFPNLLSSSPSAREVVFPFAIFLLAWLVLDIGARVSVAAFRRTAPALSVLDRLLGMALGAVKGAVLAWFLVSVMLSSEIASGMHYQGLDTDRSWVAAQVRKWPAGRLADLIQPRTLKEWEVRLREAGRDHAP